MNRKVRVALIYGGRSGEHDVSLSTAHAVIGEFDFDKYEVYPFYITRTGEWRAGGRLLAPVEDKRLLTFENDPAAAESSRALTLLFAALKPAAPGVGAAPAAEQAAAVPDAAAAAIPAAAGAATPAAPSGVPPAIDVAFPLLHGTYGEDGTIQGLFEMLNIPYVGCGVLASAAGLDKVVMKKLFASDGLPQCVYRYFTKRQWETESAYHITEIEMSLGYPCFVKPANLGSSVGITKARNREQLIAAVQEAFKYDRKVIVEEFVDAREIEVSVLGNEEPRASVPGEIVPSGEFYDYNAKYVDGKSVMIIPADIPPETAEAAREMAIRAFRAVDASGLARVDFFLKRDDGKLYVNEINTMPGFTPFSMYPMLWKESGLTYRELLDELIRLAFERHAARQSLRYG